MASLPLTSILPYLDLLWLIVVIILLPRHQWIVGLVFIAACLLMTRLQTQLILEIKSHVSALPDWAPWPILNEVMAIYAFILTLYFLLMHFSYRVTWLIHMAAGIILLMVAFTLSFCVLVL